jgi:outer membrane immunogenic protein
MKNLLLVTSGLVLLAVPAIAADVAMPMYKAPPVAGFNWIGGYLGIHLGGAWSQTDVGETSVAPNPLLGNTNGTITTSGIMGGGQIGYNIGMVGNWLWGVELDVSGVDLNGSTTTTPGPGGGTVGWTDKADALGTMRMRFGYVAGNWLFYGTGGLGWEHDKLTRTQQLGGVNAPPVGFVATTPANPVGWVAGGGIEWGFARNWTAKLEYLHFDLGSNPQTTPLIILNQTTVNIDTVKVGVNYLFN